METKGSSAEPGAPTSKHHPESLLHLHPVAHMLHDPAVRLRRRGVDARWKYRRHIKTSYGGFSPHTGCVYYPAHSYFERWRKASRDSARAYNVGDRLLPELMFVVHDYLHVWTYGWIHSLMPDLGFGRAPITRENIEDFAFCHLLTEAVATVGLDYWYLSTIDINTICNIGTDFTNLTVSYRESYEAEYRRFNPSFCPQKPDFFSKIVRFYCTGDFFGFDKEDLLRSPRVYAWLSHELRYGVAQRRYSRLWLRHLSGLPLSYTEATLRARVSPRGRWKTWLMREIGERLWVKMKQGELLSPPRKLAPEEGWRSPTGRPFDFRFINYNATRDRELALFDQPYTQDEFKHLFDQFLAQFNADSIDVELLRLNELFIEKRDIKLARHIYRDQPRIRRGLQEPRDLFFLN